MHEGTRVELRKFVAPEFVFGDGALYMVQQYVRNLGGSKAFVVSDEGVIKAGWTDKAVKQLREEGLGCNLFSGLTPNPKDAEVMNGVEQYRKAGCDIIVAIGGGSPIDCAKGIGIIVSNGGDILDYEGIDQIPMPCPPLICIPTTIGSAADVSQFAIITASKENRKIAIVSKALVPEVSLIDPEVTTTLSSTLAAATGFDTLSHAFEAYVSNANSPITDLFALEAIRLVSDNLMDAVENRGNPEARGNMMLATLDAGLAFSNASLGLVHAMSHSLGGLTDLEHGMLNACLLSAVVDFNYPAVPERYNRIAEAMGIDLRGLDDTGKREALKKRLIELCRRTDILEKFDIPKEDMPVLVENTLRDPSLITNPRPVSGSDIEKLYENVIKIYCESGKTP